MERALDQRGQRRQADEELAEVIEAELLGVVEGVHPPPVDDLPLPHDHAHEVQAEDADRVQDRLARTPLIEMPQARHQPRQEGRHRRVTQIHARLSSSRCIHLQESGAGPPDASPGSRLAPFDASRRPHRDLPRPTVHAEPASLGPLVIRDGTSPVTPTRLRRATASTTSGGTTSSRWSRPGHQREPAS